MSGKSLRSCKGGDEEKEEEEEDCENAGGEDSTAAASVGAAESGLPAARAALGRWTEKDLAKGEGRAGGKGEGGSLVLNLAPSFKRRRSFLASSLWWIPPSWRTWETRTAVRAESSPPDAGYTSTLL